MDQQLGQKQSLDPRSNACAQVLELPLSPELQQWDEVSRQGKAGGELWASRGVQHLELIFAYFISSLLPSHLGGTTDQVKEELENVTETGWARSR